MCVCVLGGGSLAHHHASALLLLSYVQGVAAAARRAARGPPSPNAPAPPDAPASLRSAELRLHTNRRMSYQSFPVLPANRSADLPSSGLMQPLLCSAQCACWHALQQ
jgi:hypothetical protein